MNTTHNRDLVVITEEGVMKLLYPTTNSPGVLVDGATNKMGENNQSAIPNNIETLQNLIDLLGPIAFQREITSSNLSKFMTTSKEEKTTGKIPDATLIREIYESLNNLDVDIEIDATLSKSGMAPDSAIVGQKITNLEKQLEDLAYSAITITAFSNNKNTIEKGSTVTEVVLSYTLSKAPKSATIDGSEITISGTSGSKTLSGLSLTANKTWTLKVTDERDASASKTTSLNFYNGVYYGVSSSTAYDSNLITSLANKVLSNTKAMTVTVNAGTGQYIFYCIPSSLGSCSFNVGGFDGGFTKVATISYTNPSGYTENYDIYKSDNAGLGNTTVKIS